MVCGEGERAEVVPFGDAFKPQLQERFRQSGPGGRAHEQFRPAGRGQFRQDPGRRLVEVVGVVDDQQQGLLGGALLLFQVRPQRPQHGQLRCCFLDRQSDDEGAEDTVGHLGQRRAAVDRHRRHLGAQLRHHGFDEPGFAHPAVAEDEHGHMAAALEGLHCRHQIFRPPGQGAGRRRAGVSRRPPR